MSQSDKAAIFQELKAAGVKFDKHYREYSTADLEAALIKLRASQPAPPPKIEPELSPEEMAAIFPNAAASARMPAPAAAAPALDRDPEEMPGQRLNTQTDLEPIRTDAEGRVWYQEEVQKPSFPKPRGRRVLQYTDSGTEIKTVQAGEFVETFEVSGPGAGRTAEIKITLPSYQVGIYKDRRFPFKVHTYNDKQGFDLFEVQNYYGGAEMVPVDVKRTYVENVLCYDVRTTVRAIQTEFRQLQLAGKVK